MFSVGAMTPKELCMGLMRGNRIEVRRGVGPESAATAAGLRHDLGEADFRALLAFAFGFSHGMLDAIHAADAAVPPGPPPPKNATRHYEEGRALGCREDGLSLFPAQAL